MVYVNQAEPQLEQKTVDALNKLKQKTIQEFSLFLNKVSKGKNPDYTFIMNELNLIDIVYCKSDEYKFYFLLQKYLKTKWQVKVF